MKRCSKGNHTSDLNSVTCGGAPGHVLVAPGFGTSRRRETRHFDPASIAFVTRMLLLQRMIRFAVLVWEVELNSPEPGFNRIDTSFSSLKHHEYGWMPRPGAQPISVAEHWR